MSHDSFQALLLTSDATGTHHAFQRLSLDALPPGDVRVAVAYSSLNYKDGLAVTGAGKVVRTFPMVPGIDLAGVVEASSSPEFQPGDRVLANGWGLGEEHWGGFAQKASVRASWLTRVPESLDLEQAMAIGTAGFTAMLGVMALETYGLDRDGPVLVTGAAGGVGSLAVALLSNAGYRVVASTGRAGTLAGYLRSLGANEVLDREQLARRSKPLESERWAGAIDSVGATTLATVLSQMRYGTAVAACGLAGGTALETTVFPFILRGVGLLGINSVYCPTTRRELAWRRLATELPAERIAAITQRIGLAEVPRMSEAILGGEVRGRIVVDVNG